MKLFPAMVDELELLKHGDIFTITPDKTANNWSMVKNKTFIAVPKNYQSPELKEIWDKKIKEAENEIN